jgi:RNA polymerase sigma factor (sigma-70 family)
VGADAAAVALSEAPDKSDDLVLVVDVGTNAEILLGDKRRVLACSSPTGPAFEGAQISSGQRAAPGAIERLEIDPATKEPRFKVIGCDLWSTEPGFEAATEATGITGICGSGIIEAVAEMRMAGIVDASGLIGSAEQVGTDRMILQGRTHAYLIHDGSAAGGPVITVTQGDIRAIQLAKSALYAGARLLMDELGVDQVDRVVLAGAFGAHISPKHAMVLGMIPDVPLEKVQSAGNAAGTGARIALCNAGARVAIEETVGRIHKVETAIEPRFQEHFVAANAIPHATAPFPRTGPHRHPAEPQLQHRGGRGRRPTPAAGLTGMHDTADPVAEMLARVAGQDRSAFRDLYAATSAKLFGTLLRILGNRAEAEDALQEVFTRVWLRATRFDAAKGRGMTWLITLARNHAIDRLRARPAPADGDDALATVADAAPRAEARVEAKSEARRIEACFEELEDGRADAVRGAYLDGLSYQDLARGTTCR